MRHINTLENDLHSLMFLTGDINIENESIKLIIHQYKDIDDKVLIEYHQFRVFKGNPYITKCKMV